MAPVPRKSRKRKAESKNKGGRPSAYHPNFAHQAYHLCLLGATDGDLAGSFGVDESTIDRWKQKYPRFCGSIKRGKDGADAKVAESLFKRALGYSHEAVKIFCSDGEVTQVKYTEHYPPDTGAACFWLKNRQRGRWTDVHKIEASVANLETVNPRELSAAELDALLARVAASAKQEGGA